MASAKRTADHDEIREWVESKGGRPAIVEGTSGMLRIDFGEPDERLEATDWDTFFRIFDDSSVEFLYDPEGWMTKFVPAGMADRTSATERPRRAARRSPRAASSSRKKSGTSRKKSTASRKKSTSSTGARKKTTSSRKKSTSTRKKSSTGTRKKSTTGRKKTTTARKKTTTGRKKSTTGRKKSTTGRKKSTTGRKKTTSARKTGGRKYSKKAQRKVGKVMHEYKQGGLKSGRSGAKVKSRKQAIAIGISEARREGDKVPKRKSSGRKKSSNGRKKRS